MKKKLFWFAAIAIMPTVVACSSDAPDPTPEPDPAIPELSETIVLPQLQYGRGSVEMTSEDLDMADRSARFAFKLYTLAGKQYADNPNIVLSPVSAAAALSMSANGAAGDTYKEMAAALGFDGVDLQTINEYNYKLLATLPRLHDGVRLRIANVMFSANDAILFPNFVQRMHTYYDAEYFNGEISPDVINAWVAQNTDNMITKLMDENSTADNMDLVLLNALRLQASWTAGELDVCQEDFTNSDGSLSTSDFLKTSINYSSISNDTFDAISVKLGKSIALTSNNFRYTIFLPKEGKTIDDCVNALSKSSWTALLKSFKGNGYFNDAYFPAFKAENKISLLDILANMGIKLALHPTAADFSNMTWRKLFIGNISQANVFEVDKNGVSGASATEEEFLATANPDEHETPPDFRANRPYIYVVTENSTGAILFIGKHTRVE